VDRGRDLAHLHQLLSRESSQQPEDQPKRRRIDESALPWASARALQ
jgi:hypothetical protein